VIWVLEKTSSEVFSYGINNVMEIKKISSILFLILIFVPILLFFKVYKTYKRAEQDLSHIDAVNDKLYYADSETVVRNFFNFINKGKVDEAFKNFSSDFFINNGDVNLWKKQYSNIAMISIIAIKPYTLGDEVLNKDTIRYKVVFYVEMSKDSARAPIPYYGWTSPNSTRFVTLQKIKDQWKITGIGTGP
jgi:hypothetical protein